jgi:hypothetical protein
MIVILLDFPNALIFCIIISRCSTPSIRFSFHMGNFSLIMIVLLCYLFYLKNESLKMFSHRFVKVEKIKDQLLECNKETYWVPDYVKVFHGFLCLTHF